MSKNVHAIGDRANNIILNAFEKALEGANVSALRPRIEHAQMMTKEDMVRLGKLGGKYNNIVVRPCTKLVCSHRKCTAHSCVCLSIRMSCIKLTSSRISDMWYAEDRLVGLFLYNSNSKGIDSLPGSRADQEPLCLPIYCR